MNDGIKVLVGTRKGAFLFKAGPERADWVCEGPMQLGAVVNHMVPDRRGSATLLMAAKTGHLGPTVMRSVDQGATWQEATRPPAFPKAAEGEKGQAVDAVFWLEPGHASQPGVWYAGTIPHALFRSKDDGDTWDEVAGFRAYLASLDQDFFGEVPGGAITHSINVDPRDPRHLYVGVSGGGFFESKDEGASWHPLNQGLAADFMPDPNVPYGHDPHCVQLHPLKPDRLYQQNHCGIYRLDRPDDRWVRIGDAMPREVGDVGFAVQVHPHDADTAWVFPMDGTDVWPRISPGGRPAVFRTRNAGESWERLNQGLPAEQAWWTVYRQAMAADAQDRVGLYMGTTSGELWGSADEGDSWRLIARNLPAILSVEVG
ncbi:MAG: repeat-containing glycosyl hydrolase [Cyanobacteria bacterium RYN_339]|nr:repeat-containing glycosyl hydrolase [Cyanobacteria bacterium RYN_339]